MSRSSERHTSPRESHRRSCETSLDPGDWDQSQSSWISERRAGASGRDGRPRHSRILRVLSGGWIEDSSRSLPQTGPLQDSPCRDRSLQPARQPRASTLKSLRRPAAQFRVPAGRQHGTKRTAGSTRSRENIDSSSIQPRPTRKLGCDLCEQLQHRKWLRLRTAGC